MLGCTSRHAWPQKDKGKRRKINTRIRLVNMITPGLNRDAGPHKVEAYGEQTNLSTLKSFKPQSINAHTETGETSAMQACWIT